MISLLGLVKSLGILCLVYATLFSVKLDYFAEEN